MSQGRKGRLNYRCPICFGREIDVDMFYDKDKDEYYCIRCPYVGKEAEILELNEKNKFRYKSGFKRLNIS
jgi:hypothetical protein